MSKYLFLTTALTLIGASAAYAEPEATSGDEVIVSVTRLPVKLSQLGQSVSVLTEADIAKAQSLQVSDLLSRTPDFHVVRYGGPGQTTSGFVRGAESDQTLYIVDGVRLSDPSQVGGGGNLGLIPSQSISRIEVLRGPYSTLWGSRALGGVVAITSREPQTPFETRFRIEGGEDYNNQSVWLGGKTGRLNYGLSTSNTHDVGVSAFAGGNEADGFDQTVFSGHARFSFSDTAGMILRLAHSHSRTDFDGYPAPLYAFADTAEAGKIKEEAGAIGFYHKAFDGRLDQSLTYSRLETGSRFLNDDRTPNYLSTGVVDSVDYIGRFTFDPTTSGMWVITRETTEMTTRYPAVWDPNPVPFKADTGRTSVAGQIQKQFTSGLSANLALRHEDDDAFGSHDLAHAAVAYQVQPNLTLRAAIGQGFKAPSLYQLYSDYGNAALKPETSQSYEAGFDLDLAEGKSRISVSGFERRSSDQIGFFSCFGSTDPRCVTQPYGFYDNIARTKARGIEFEGHYDFGFGGTLSGNLTRLIARDESASSFTYHNDLARRPRALARVDYDQSVGDFTFGGGYSFTGKAFDDAANSRALKAYGLVDLRAGWSFAKGYEVFARIENAGDKAYETAAGYGSVGRRFWLGLRTR